VLGDLGSYAEVSPTGTGVKVFLRGRWPANWNRRGPVEVYDRGRYFTVTGRRLPQAPPSVNERQAALERFHADGARGVQPAGDNPAVKAIGALDDDLLIQRARQARNGDRFARLWDGDPSGYQSESEADLALCGHLAYWTGRDADRVDRLFRLSGLFRPKWDERRGEETYGQRTIATALNGMAHESNGQAVAGPNGRPAADPEARPEPVLVALADVEAPPVSWLWRHWIPRGAVTVLDGDPGLGKSTISTDLAARASRGWEMPPAGGPCQGAEPAGVLLLSAEDDPARTIRPRLDAAGADVSRVWLLDAMRTGDDERPPVLPWDLDRVAGTIGERDVSLMVIDPMLAYLDGGIDAHRDQDVRRCLHRLQILAQSTGVAILLIRHLNKLAGGPALYRGGGSIGIAGAARSALLVGRHPTDSALGVLAGNKCNLGPMPRSLTFRIEAARDVSRIAWGEATDLTAADILAQPGGRRRQTTAEQCAEAIREMLAAGPMESRQLDDELRQRGYSPRAIRDGRRLALVQPDRSEFGGRCVVRLAPGDGREGEANE
jgi:hypothetical protein